MLKLIHQLPFITLSTFAVLAGCGGSDSTSSNQRQGCSDSGVCPPGTGGLGEPAPRSRCSSRQAWIPVSSATA